MVPATHDTGTGDPVLFLHAFTMDASQWDHQVAALSEQVRCLRVDFWGCGASPPPPDGPPSLAAFAASTLDALDSLGIDRFAVVGLSMGGYLAFELWRLAPSRIRSLAICNTRATADVEGSRNDRLAMADQVEHDGSVESIVEPMVVRLLSPWAREEAHIADPVRGRIRRCSPAGIAFAQRAIATRPDSTELLDTIDVPSLVIAGTQDMTVGLSEVHAIADRIKDARYAELDCGHLSNLEMPRPFNDALAGFLVPAGTVS